MIEKLNIRLQTEGEAVQLSTVFGTSKDEIIPLFSIVIAQGIRAGDPDVINLFNILKSTVATVELFVRPKYNQRQGVFNPKDRSND